jgi:hypothetical protein
MRIDKDNVKRCRFRFPQEFRDDTIILSNGVCKYRRRNNTDKGFVEKWVGSGKERKKVKFTNANVST